MRRLPWLGLLEVGECTLMLHVGAQASKRQVTHSASFLGPSVFTMYKEVWLWITVSFVHLSHVDWLLKNPL